MILPFFKTTLLFHQAFTLYGKDLNPPFWENFENSNPPSPATFYKVGCNYVENLFPIINTLSELYFRLRRFILLVQKNKVISMSYGSSTSTWKLKRKVRLELIFMMRDIYINSNQHQLSKFSSSSRSTNFIDVLPLNISQMITKTVKISMRIVVSSAMKRGVPFWIWRKVNGNWDNNMIWIYQRRKNPLQNIY